MRSMVVALIVGMALSAFSPLAAQDLPTVENWIKIGEERVVVNKTTGAGLVRRYYVDPNQEFGVGSTLSVFRQDGFEELFWRGLNLYTIKGAYALKFRGSFYPESHAGQLTSNMMTLDTMLEPLKDKIKNDGGIDKLWLCLSDKDGKVLLIDKEGVCYLMDFSR